MAARKRSATITGAIAKGLAAGMLIGLVAGPIVGSVWLSLLAAQQDEPPNPNGSPGLAIAPFLFAFVGAVVCGVLLGGISGVRMWLATDTPTAAARHRETMRRFVAFAVPASIGVIVGLSWGSFVHSQAIESMQANAAAAGRFATDAERRVPGLKALGAFLLCAVPGVYLGVIALRRRRSQGSDPG